MDHGGSEEPTEPGEPATAAAGQDPAGRPAAPTKRPRSRRRRRITLAVVAVVVLWVVVDAVLLALAAGHIHQGETAVQSAKQGLSANGILSGAPRASLDSAAGSFSAAHGLLSSPLLWPVDVLPVAGRQLRSVQDLSGAAEQVARTGVVTVDRSQALLRLPHSAGPERVAALHQLAALATTTHVALADVDLGPVQGLIGPLAHERNTFQSDLDQIRTTLTRTSDAASSAATILQGPATYLLLAGNNAEMRSGSGAFLEAGILTTADGELHLSGMVPTASLTLPPGAVPVTGDLQARWGSQQPGTDWRNIGLTPQFDVNGPLAADMWKAAMGQSVDGVLAIDVQGLQELLEVTGPVTTSTGTVVSAANVDQLLLHDQYVGETYTSNSTGRVDELSNIATATLHALENQPFSLHTMADALSAAASGRHVMLWSADPHTEAAWRGAGVAGDLQPSSLMADVINRGGNKLDQYLSETASLRLTPHGGQTDATITMTFTNHTPPGQSEFIAGPYPGLGTVYGQYVGIATVNLPPDASHISSPPGQALVANGPEGPTILQGTPVSILPGASQQVTFHFVLPGAHGAMTVVPSARIPAATWQVGGTTFQDDSPHTISW